MRLPRLDDIPQEVPRAELGRGLEAMLAGLRSDPPDSFVDDWDESMKEVERLLDEIERGQA